MKFSSFPNAVIKENVDYTVKEITNVIKKYGNEPIWNQHCAFASVYMMGFLSGARAVRERKHLQQANKSKL